MPIIPIVAAVGGLILASGSELRVGLEYSTHYLWGWVNCLEGQSLGGGPAPLCVVRASTDGYAESVGSCAVPVDQISRPVRAPFEVSAPPADFSALPGCWDEYTGSCSFNHPGQPYAFGFVYTFEPPVWTDFWNGSLDMAGSAGVPQSRVGVCCDSQGVIPSIRITSHRADFTADGVIDGADLAVLFTFWGQPQWRRADLNDDGAIDGADLAMLFADWGPVSPP